MPVRLVLWRTRSRASGADRQLLQSILGSYSKRWRGRPRVIIATPKRFLRAKRLAAPGDPIRMMLQFIDEAQKACNRRGLSFSLMASEDIPPDAADTLIFSHHTYQDEFFTALAKANNTVWHYKAADLPGTMVVDQGGFSGWSSLADLTIDDIPATVDDETLARYFDQSRADLLTSNVSKYAQPSRADHGAPAAKPYVFIALQKKYDLVQKQAYMPMLEMLDLVVERFLDTEFDIVIKRHPLCRDKDVEDAIHGHLAKSSRISLSNRSIHDLLAGAKAVFTVNSGVGSEAMIHETPIYCFGRADYAPAAHQISSASDLKRLTSPIRSRLTPAELRRFYHYYRTGYQVQSGPSLARRIARILDEHFGLPPRDA